MLLPVFIRQKPFFSVSGNIYCTKIYSRIFHSSFVTKCISYDGPKRHEQKIVNLADATFKACRFLLCDFKIIKNRDC